jgi:radical SAM superfamily enzyme YgiQ (UPF0313 family)
VSHPILDDDDLTRRGGGRLARLPGRVRHLDFITASAPRASGIGVEATVILGTDDHDEDAIKRLVDFLLEVKLDLAEFTIMTPFPHSPIRGQMEAEGRILSNDWNDYTCDKVVFRPKRMSPEKLQELYCYAWDTFYRGSGHALKMGELFKTVVRREIEDRTYRRYEPGAERAFLRTT